MNENKEGMRYSWVYSIGTCDSEKALRDKRESGDEKDNRGESKVKALVRLSNGRKSSCFWSCTQSEIIPVNLQNKGLGGVLALLTVKQNPQSFFLDLFTFFTPSVVFKRDRGCCLE